MNIKRIFLTLLILTFTGPVFASWHLQIQDNGQTIADVQLDDQSHDYPFFNQHLSVSEPEQQGIWLTRLLVYVPKQGTIITLFVRAPKVDGEYQFAMSEMFYIEKHVKLDFIMFYSPTKD